jgi:hypothetical protein
MVSRLSVIANTVWQKSQALGSPFKPVIHRRLLTATKPSLATAIQWLA